MREKYVYHDDAISFLDNHIPRRSVKLFCIDPPYHKIVKDSWDNKFKSVNAYLMWLKRVFAFMRLGATKDASLICFQGLGVPGEYDFPIDQVRNIAREVGWHWRNWITWQKRRAYGKSHDYLFCREEILWFSVSPERTKVTFNIPLTDQLRGYPGWNKKFPAKSPYKRVSNVWTDIPELMRPQRNCQKPIPLMERIVRTHSNPGDLVVDTFAGWGTTGIAARRLGRNFLGCEAIAKDAHLADGRIRAAKPEKAA